MDFISSWQHLPETINPIALSVGFFSLYWYAIFFLGGVSIALLFALFFARRGEAPCSEEEVFDVFLFLFIGALVGGRLGYVFFYNPAIFLLNPLAIISPYDFSAGVWTGIAGMSYHGGLLGAIVALYWFIRKKSIRSGWQSLAFWKMADFVSLLAPVAIFFGRLGNFFNVELYGRVTDKPWGMIFPGIQPIGVLRHPSTLYEAFFEGMILFILLLFFRKRMPFSGALTCLYLAGYGGLRFVGEYFREPDTQIGLFFGGAFSLGQLFSAVLFVSAGVIFIWLKRKNRATMMQKS